MSDLNFSVNMDSTEDNMITKIIKTLEEKSKLVREQTTIMDIKTEELNKAKADLAETEVF